MFRFVGSHALAMSFKRDEYIYTVTGIYPAGEQPLGLDAVSLLVETDAISAGRFRLVECFIGTIQEILAGLPKRGRRPGTVECCTADG